MNEAILKFIREGEKKSPNLFSGIRYERAPDRRRAPGDCIDETISVDECIARRIAERLGINPERER